jgi:hypothetical protein
MKQMKRIETRIEDKPVQQAVRGTNSNGSVQLGDVLLDVFPYQCPDCKRLLYIRINDKIRCPCGRVVSTFPEGENIEAQADDSR